MGSRLEMQVGFGKKQNEKVKKLLISAFVSFVSNKPQTNYRAPQINFFLILKGTPHV